jgi:hypothetical protein
MNGRDDDGPPPAGGRGGGGSSSMRLWWWLPVLVIAIVVAVILVRGGDDAEQPGAGPDTPSLEPVEPGGAGTGSMTIGGEPAAPLLEALDLSGHAGEEVIGTLVPVDSVIAQGVLWVGEGRAQILLLEPEDEATPLAPGDVITFRGTLQALDDETRDAVWGAEIEDRLESQGVYVAVDELAVGAP